MTRSIIEGISLFALTTSMQMRKWISRRIKRRKCQEWGEMIWREQLLSTLLNRIGILKKKRFVEIVKTKILLQDINAKYVRCLSSWWNCLIFKIEGSKSQLNTIKKLQIKFLCLLIKPKSATFKKKILTLFMQYTIRSNQFFKTVMSFQSKTWTK